MPKHNDHDGPWHPDLRGVERRLAAATRAVMTTTTDPQREAIAADATQRLPELRHVAKRLWPDRTEIGATTASSTQSLSGSSAERSRLAA